MLAEYFSWWAEQMRSLLPQRLSAGSRYDDALVVRSAGSTMSVATRRRGVESPATPLRPGAPRTGPVVLALPPSALLEQAISLPLAAERALAAVLRNEMDRLTPFRADDLFWSWRVDRRDRANGRILLRLLLVPKMSVKATVAAIEAAGLRPAALEVVTATSTEHISLAAPEAKAEGARSARLAAAVCCVLAVVAAGLPVILQELEIRSVEAEVAALRPGVTLVDNLRRRLAATLSGADLFAAERARVGNPLRALAAVTAALPDDTYLTTLSIREGAIALSGRSAAATRLIGALAAEPGLRDPAFDAPVTRIGNKADLFSIRAKLAP